MTDYLVALATIAGIQVLLTLGLTLHFGITGLVNFGHVAFYALGAYASALLTLAGAVLIAVGGAVLAVGGEPARRHRHAAASRGYFAILTCGSRWCVAAPDARTSHAARRHPGSPPWRRFGVPDPSPIHLVLALSSSRSC